MKPTHVFSFFLFSVLKCGGVIYFALGRDPGMSEFVLGKSLKFVSECRENMPQDLMVKGSIVAFKRRGG